MRHDLIGAIVRGGAPSPDRDGWILVPRTWRERVAMFWHFLCGRALPIGRNARGRPEYLVTVAMIAEARRK